MFCCTGSGNEYTHVYGGDWNSGNFTPFIANCFKPHIQSCILDGEMVGYNAETKTIGTIGFEFFLVVVQVLHHNLCLMSVF